MFYFNKYSNYKLYIIFIIFINYKSLCIEEWNWNNFVQDIIHYNSLTDLLLKHFFFFVLFNYFIREICYQCWYNNQKFLIFHNKTLFIALTLDNIRQIRFCLSIEYFVNKFALFLHSEQNSVFRSTFTFSKMK